MIFLICGNLKQDTNEPVYEINRNSLIENRLAVAKGKRGGGVKNWEAGISRHKLLYTEWTSKKVLL